MVRCTTCLLYTSVLLAQSKNWSVIDFNASKPYKGIDNTCYTTELPAITLKAQEATGAVSYTHLVEVSSLRVVKAVSVEGQILLDPRVRRPRVYVSYRINRHDAVSYTHLDVYKRQGLRHQRSWE